MRLCYVVLSPAFGMHQYTSDLANRLAGATESDSGSAEVTVIAPFGIPLDRYAPHARVLPLVKIEGTGLRRTNLNLRGLYQVYRAIKNARPEVVHFTGPHIWNPILLQLLRRARIPTVHTIHDLDPHSGAGYGRLLHVWNGLIVRWAGRILVHGHVYRDRLVARGVSPQRVTYTPLLMLCLSNHAEATLRQRPPLVNYEPFVLLFGRIEAYKGVDILIEALRQLSSSTGLHAVIAGRLSDEYVLPASLPDSVELRSHHIDDAEAVDLFSRCGVVVLPYRDATQSAIIATAYFFSKPVIVTRTGALPEYVVEGQTGWIVDPDNVGQLASALQTALGDLTRASQVGSAGYEWYEAQRCQELEALKFLYEELAYGEQRAEMVTKRPGE
jgi:glycosyltransferase involved in cell wall biosynthesis